MNTFTHWFVASTILVAGIAAANDGVLGPRDGVLGPRDAVIGLRLEGAAPPRISAVAPGSPAARAGLRPGDRLARVNDQVVRDGDALAAVLASTEPGTSVSFEVDRAGELVHGRLDVVSRATWQEALDRPPSGAREAPPIDVAQWFGEGPKNLEELRGKVVVIDFFQMWCPGCNRFSGPLMDRWHGELGSREDIAFLGIHTVFEGHSAQTPDRLRGYLREKKVPYPVGVDRQESGERLPNTMKRWRTRGTPEIAVVDKRGRVRFRRFGSFDPAPVRELIGELLDEQLLDLSEWL